MFGRSLRCASFTPHSFVVRSKNMKTREVTSLALKLFAIYLLLEALFSVPLVFSMYLVREFKLEQAEGQWLFVVGVGTLILALALVVAIWKLANRSLIESLKNESDSKALKIVPSEIELIIFAALGLYLVVTSVSSLVSSLTSSYIAANEALSFGVDPSSYIFIGTSIVQALIGCSLAVYPRKWSNLFSRVRRG